MGCECRWCFLGMCEKKMARVHLARAAFSCCESLRRTLVADNGATRLRGHRTLLWGLLLCRSLLLYCFLSRSLLSRRFLCGFFYSLLRCLLFRGHVHSPLCAFA